jgi:hypothetical protein
MKYTASGQNPFLLRGKFEELMVQVEGMGIKRALLFEKWLTGELTSKESLDKVSLSSFFVPPVARFLSIKSPTRKLEKFKLQNLFLFSLKVSAIT